jgi:hypothetical protein
MARGTLGNQSVVIDQGTTPDRGYDLYNAMSRQASGMAPPGARIEQPQREIPKSPDAGLPYFSVAAQVVGKEIARLEAAIAGCESELARGVMGASGIVVPHVAAEHGRIREHIGELRAEAERLSGLSQHEVRVWASEHRHLWHG